MGPDSFLNQAFIYLIAAVIAVPIAKRLGLGSVLGYLLAGVAIGPFGFTFVGSDTEEILHFAEFGVVMMLFLIGLELNPRVLWKMRVPILGMGGAQLGLSAAALALATVLLGWPVQGAIAIGLILALSSTAIVLQTLQERGLSSSQAGRASLSILLFQDVAVIPIIALLPLLGRSLVGLDGLGTASQPRWDEALLVGGIIFGIITVGHYVVRPLFRVIAELRLRELFVATALLVVIAAALATKAVGMSPALGTFLAGVVLADSEYRHELESDIEPFKGLLLGLFFISVGAGIDFALLADQPMMIAQLTIVLVTVKAIILFLIARLFGFDWRQRWLLTLSLAQGSEFAFVLLVYAADNWVISQNTADLLVVVVAVSMAVSPLLMLIDSKFIGPRSRFVRAGDEDREGPHDADDAPVIIAGYGRFGMIVGRFLNANGVATVVLDQDVSQIDQLRRFGMKVFYGDASRLDLLIAAGAERAKLVVLAMDDADRVTEAAKSLKQRFPELTVMARAYDRRHAFELLQLDVDLIVRETFGSALDLGQEALKALGASPIRARRAAQLFKDYDEQTVRQLATLWSDGDEKVYLRRAHERARELEQLIQNDRQEIGGVQSSVEGTGDASPSDSAESSTSAKN
ncbi:MAG: monovalent cation:proton antiporter-2 (CPA2) family protein [Geminicoccaceae bacterium]